MSTRAESAAARSNQMNTRASRPMQRRSAEEPDSGAWVSAKIERMQFMDRNAHEMDLMNFRGYASMSERGYTMHDMFGEYTEVVARGAFASSLLREDLDVP